MAPAASLLQSTLDRYVASGCTGVILAVEAPSLSVIFAGASGLFERGRSKPLRPSDPFRAASVSKAITAASVVRLAASGKWNLDDPIAPYLQPQVVGQLKGMHGLSSVDALTIRRLLNHTSGMPDYFADEQFQARVQAEPTKCWRPEELVEAATKAGPLAFPPGSDFSYGDTGYVLVGLAIERLLGVPLADAYRSLIFNPLGMNATFLEWHERRRGHQVSHHYDGNNDLLTMNTSFDWAGGGLVTTAGDLVRFLRALFGEAIFERRWINELTAWRDGLRWRPHSSARYLRYGLGIGLNLADGQEIIGATGIWGAFAYYWPAADAAIAGTVNMRGVDRAVLLDEIVRALRNA